MNMQSRFLPLLALLSVVCAADAQAGGAQASKPVTGRNTPAPATTATAAAAAAPADYVIGADDVLSIVFWRDKEMSGDVVVRPDGHISLPLINDIRAAGHTPDQLRGELVKAAAKYLEDPNATVVVKEIKSRNVYILGNVGKPGRYPLTAAMNVMQLIALVGGLAEYADGENIQIIRTTAGAPQQLKFNYKEILKQKRPEQNVMLQPGDTVVVP
jgi:polysaccharide export outer membrane protein